MLVADDDSSGYICPSDTVARYSSCYYNHTLSPARDNNQAAISRLNQVDETAAPSIEWAPSDSSDCWGVTLEVGRVLSFGGFGSCGLALSAICLLSRSTMPEPTKDSLTNVLLVSATGLGLGAGVFWTFTDDLSTMLAAHSRNVGLVRRPAVPVACAKPRSRCLRKRCVAEDCVTLANGGTDCYCVETECGNTPTAHCRNTHPALSTQHPWSTSSPLPTARSQLTSPTTHCHPTPQRSEATASRPSSSSAAAREERQRARGSGSGSRGRSTCPSAIRRACSRTVRTRLYIRTRLHAHATYAKSGPGTAVK